MSALAQPTRLLVYRLLIERSPEQMAAGDIAACLRMSRSSMSPHFAILAGVGLVSSTKEGRNVFYRAETNVVEELADLLAAAVQRQREGRVDLLDW